MSAPRGRTYLVQLDHLVSEYMTVLDNGDFIVEDWVDDRFTYLVRDELDDYAASDPPYTAHIADRIRHELIDSAHDGCGWAWQPRAHEPDVWHRPGRCPSCGRW